MCLYFPWENIVLFLFLLNMLCFFWPNLSVKKGFLNVILNGFLMNAVPIFGKLMKTKFIIKVFMTCIFNKLSIF